MPETVDLAAKRYAQAAFELAVERGSTHEWDEALQRIAEFMSDRDVSAVLENRRIPEETKQNLVEAALGDLSPLPLNLARLLVAKSRTHLAEAVAQQFHAMLEEREGIVHVRARTAVALNDAERQALIDRLQGETGRKVILETEVDPALLGGLVVQIGDRMIDASTRAKLEALHDSLVGTA